MDLTTSTRDAPRYCDLDHVLATMTGNRAVVEKLANLFLGILDNYLQALDAAQREANPATLLRTAHDIRGSCGLFSATACVDLARMLESQAREQVESGPAGQARWLEAWSGDCERLREMLLGMGREMRDFLHQGRA